jgi:hypothetical protein
MNLLPYIVKVKIKASHNKPGQTLRVAGGRSSQKAHESSKVVSPTYRPPLPPEDFLDLIYIRG